MTVCLYAGLLALVYVGLSFNVTLRRVKDKVLFGDNGDTMLMRAVRIHGNFAEYVPFILFLMFLYENTGGSRYMVHATGIALILSRALHVWGLWWDKVPGRLAGMVITMLLLVMLGVMLTIKGFQFMALVAHGPMI